MIIEKQYTQNTEGKKKNTQYVPCRIHGLAFHNKHQMEHQVLEYIRRAVVRYVVAYTPESLERRLEGHRLQHTWTSLVRFLTGGPSLGQHEDEYLYEALRRSGKKAPTLTQLRHMLARKDTASRITEQVRRSMRFLVPDEKTQTQSLDTIPDQTRHTLSAYTAAQLLHLPVGHDDASSKSVKNSLPSSKTGQGEAQGEYVDNKAEPTTSGSSSTNSNPYVAPPRSLHQRYENIECSPTLYKAIKRLVRESNDPTRRKIPHPDLEFFPDTKMKTKDKIDLRSIVKAARRAVRGLDAVADAPQYMLQAVRRGVGYDDVPSRWLTSAGRAFMGSLYVRLSITDRGMLNSHTVAWPFSEYQIETLLRGIGIESCRFYYRPSRRYVPREKLQLQRNGKRVAPAYELLGPQFRRLIRHGETRSGYSKTDVKYRILSHVLRSVVRLVLGIPRDTPFPPRLMALFYNQFIKNPVHAARGMYHATTRSRPSSSINAEYSSYNLHKRFAQVQRGDISQACIRNVPRSEMYPDGVLVRFESDETVEKQRRGQDHINLTTATTKDRNSIYVEDKPKHTNSEKAAFTETNVIDEVPEEKPKEYTTLVLDTYTVHKLESYLEAFLAKPCAPSQLHRVLSQTIVRVNQWTMFTQPLLQPFVRRVPVQDVNDTKYPVIHFPPSFQPQQYRRYLSHTLLPRSMPHRSYLCKILYLLCIHRGLVVWEYKKTLPPWAISELHAANAPSVLGNRVQENNSNTEKRTFGACLVHQPFHACVLKIQPSMRFPRISLAYRTESTAKQPYPTPECAVQMLDTLCGPLPDSSSKLSLPQTHNYEVTIQGNPGLIDTPLPWTLLHLGVQIVGHRRSCVWSTTETRSKQVAHMAQIMWLLPCNVSWSPWHTEEDVSDIYVRTQPDVAESVAAMISVLRQ